MHVALLCIVPDGTVPVDGTLARVAQSTAIQWPIGDSGTVALSFQGEDGASYDLTGCVVTLACRSSIGSPIAEFSYGAAIDPTPNGGAAPGTASVAIPSGATASMDPGSVHWYDVRLSKSGQAWHVMPPSRWLPTATVVRSGDPGT